MELIKAIALLCQVGVGERSYDYADKEQLKCQKSYISCVESKAPNYYRPLLSEREVQRVLIECVKERK